MDKSMLTERWIETATPQDLDREVYAQGRELVPFGIDHRITVMNDGSSGCPRCRLAVDLLRSVLSTGDIE